MKLDEYHLQKQNASPFVNKINRGGVDHNIFHIKIPTQKVFLFVWVFLYGKYRL